MATLDTRDASVTLATKPNIVAQAIGHYGTVGGANEIARVGAYGDRAAAFRRQANTSFGQDAPTAHAATGGSGHNDETVTFRTGG